MRFLLERLQLLPLWADRYSEIGNGAPVLTEFHVGITATVPRDTVIPSPDYSRHSVKEVVSVD